MLVVVCQSPSTAAWAREPIVHEAPFWMTSATYPLVLSRENVPSLKDVPEADLLLQVFSVVVHGAQTDAAGLSRLARALRQADARTRDDLATYVLLGLGYLPLAEIWRKMFAMDLETLRTSPIIRGWLDEHDQQVKSEAAAEAAAGAAAGAVLRILDKRFVGLTAAQREQIRTSTDLDQLDRWLEAALDATSADELFG